MNWRYVHRDDVTEYEREGWTRAIERDGIRNSYFVLMLWMGNTNGN